MNLYIMQHGPCLPAEVNPDQPLSPVGRDQMSASARAMRVMGLWFDALVCSPRPAAAQTAAKVSISQDRGSALSIDLRGSMVDDACLELDRFIDNALITGVHEFYVVHGKGTGALRSGVQQYLKNHPRVKTFRIGAYGEGDAGVTVVTLKS